MANRVIGNINIRDKHTFEILTGRFQYYADQCCGQKYYGALKTLPCANGSVNMVPSSGRISRINITDTGTGYSTAPEVVISGTGGATATASVHNGKVVLINIIQRGDGYSTPPTISFRGTTGSGARAEATLTLEEPDIDFSAALAVKGVHAVLNHLDARGNYGNNVLLASSANFWGAPIAAVVADDWDTANYACGLIKVNYTENDWVTDPHEVMKENKPAVSWSGIRPSATTDDQYDAEYAACTYKTTHVQGFTTCYAHNMLEPHGNTAWWVGDHVYCWTGSQHLRSCHETFIGALNRNNISHTCHTFTQGTGGGHGDKNTAPNMALTARMSLFVGGAPVTLVETRQTNITTHARQSGSRQSIRIGSRTSGQIGFFESDATVWGAGAGGGACTMTGMQQSFTVPYYRHSTPSLRTNTPARGSYRCVGDPPACMGYDAAIDKLAEVMGISPYTLRINCLRDSRSPTTGGYTAYRGLELPTMLTKLRDESGYTQKWTRPLVANPRDVGSKKYGIALTCHVDGHGGVASGRYCCMSAHAVASVVQVFVNAGFGRGPSGAPSAIASIVAERMGVCYDNVYVTDFGKTDRGVNGGMQAGSAFTSGCGGAAYNMADKARTDILTGALGNAVFTAAAFDNAIPSDRTRAVATANVADGRIASFTVTNQGAGYTGVPRVTVSATGGGSGATAMAYVADGKVVSIGVVNPGSGYTAASVITVNIGWVSIEDLEPIDNYIYVKGGLPVPTAAAYPLNIATIIGVGSPGWWGEGWSASNSNGSCGSCAEVLVDTETGEVEVLALWNVIETGGTIFKRGAIKEMLSGCELIIAVPLFFGDIYDHWHKGALMGTQWSQSQSPTSLDLPTKDYHVYDMESDCGGPYGAHGIGEPCVSNVGAINCAIYNAIGVFPDPEGGAINPDRILKALGKA